MSRRFLTTVPWICFSQPLRRRKRISLQKYHRRRSQLRFLNPTRSEKRSWGITTLQLTRSFKKKRTSTNWVRSNKNAWNRSWIASRWSTFTRSLIKRILSLRENFWPFKNHWSIFAKRRKKYSRGTSSFWNKNRSSRCRKKARCWMINWWYIKILLEYCFVGTVNDAASRTNDQCFGKTSFFGEKERAYIRGSAWKDKCRKANSRVQTFVKRDRKWEGFDVWPQVGSWFQKSHWK